jgi:hypothetical protein
MSAGWTSEYGGAILGGCCLNAARCGDDMGLGESRAVNIHVAGSDHRRLRLATRRIARTACWLANEEKIHEQRND